MTTTDDTMLDVFLHGESVGVLTKGKKPGSATFKYHADAPYAISVSMPVREKSYDPVATRNWFTGLLPEDEDRLSHVAKRFTVSVNDYVDLLREVGRDCSGAVTFGAASHTGPDASDVFAAAIASLPAVADGLHDDSLRSTIAGYQPKTVATKSGAWNLSGVFPLSTYIVKPEPDEWPGLVDAEAWAMTVAAGAANAAGVTVETFAGKRALVVNRFDRITHDGESYAVHQEDLCQAMGLHLDRKYAYPGGNQKTSPSLKRVASLLSSYSDDPQLELDELVRHMTVNVIMGNLDWHAKNIGLLHDASGNLSLAPLYDVVPTRHFIPSDKKMSLSVNNKFLLDRIYFLDLVLEAESWGVPADRAERLVRTAVDDIASHVPIADERYPLRPDGVLKIISSQLYRFGTTLKEAS